MNKPVVPTSLEPKAAQALRFYLLVLFVTGLFAPPFAVASKRVYVFDLVLYAWPLVALVAVGWRAMFSKSNCRIWIFTGATVALMTVIFLHGQTRGDFRAELEAAKTLSGDTEAFGPFSWLQDGIQFSRFTSWVLAAGVTAAVVKTAGNVSAVVVQFATRSLAVMLAVQAGIAVLAYFTPLRGLIGRIYGYNPDYEFWANRFHGTFPSPAELAGALGLGLLWWAVELRTKRTPKTGLLLLVTAVGFFGTRSMSCFAGFAAGLLYLWRRRIFANRWITAGTALLIIGTVYFFYMSQLWAVKYQFIFDHFAIVYNKMENLRFRFGPWKVFTDAVFSQADSMILGLGFSRGHSDNSYVQLLRIGGLSLTFGFALYVFRTLWQTGIVTRCPFSSQIAWKEWAGAAIVFGVVAAGSLDLLLFRFFGPILLTLGALNLAFPSSNESYD